MFSDAELTGGLAPIADVRKFAMVGNTR